MTSGGMITSPNNYVLEELPRKMGKIFSGRWKNLPPSTQAEMDDATHPSATQIAKFIFIFMFIPKSFSSARTEKALLVDFRLPGNKFRPEPREEKFSASLKELKNPSTSSQ